MPPLPSHPPPLVSVVIPVYNGQATIGRALQSVIDQEYDAIECIVVDDGSRDESLAIAQQWQERFPDRIRVLTHPGRIDRCVAATCNLAITSSHGAYVAFLDADDVWHPEKTRRQVQLMEERPNLGLTYTKARVLRDEHTKEFIAGVAILGHTPPHGRGQCLTQILTISLNYIFSTIMVRKSCLSLTGLFDEDLSYQSEDRILVAKLSAVTDIARLPKVLCDYHAHGDNYSASAMRSGIVPAIFFELRARVAVWLKGRKEVASSTRGIVTIVLPDTFVAALISARAAREKRSVARNLFSVLRAYPLSTPRFVYAMIKHSRIGVWLRLNRPRRSDR
mgnify:FL=1